MAIITKPASIQKNSPAEISLDKAALAAVPSVAADAYFSDSTNWKEVFLYYKSSTGNQREILKFNATIASPVATFLVSDKALDIFQVQKIVIVDFDNGSITVPRSELTVADFDVDMTPAPLASPYSATLKGGIVTLSNSGFTATGANSYTNEAELAYTENILNLESSTGKYYKEFNMVIPGSGTDGASSGIGIRAFSGTPTDFAAGDMNQFTDTELMILYRPWNLGVRKQIAPNNQLENVSNPNYDYFPGPGGSSYPAYLTGIVGIALDLSGPVKKLYINRDGVWANGADPAAGTGWLDLSSELPTLASFPNLYIFATIVENRQIDISSPTLYSPAGFTDI